MAHETNHYDAVVFGGDLTGLVSAALLGRRGLRVLLVGSDRAPDTVPCGPYAVPAEPGFLPPLEQGGLARVLSELSLTPVFRRRLSTIAPSVILDLPSGRFDLGAPDSKLFEDLDRCFPDNGAAIRTVFTHLAEISAVLDPILASDLSLPPGGFWDRREVARYEARLPRRDSDPLAPLPPNHPLRAGITAVAALSARFAPGDLGVAPLARGFALARRGVFRIAGGLGELRRLFLDRLLTLSGETRTRVSAVELLTRRGRVSSVRLRPRDERIGLDHLLWAAPLAELVPVLDEQAGSRLRELLVGVRPACYRYCLSFVVRKEGLENGAGARVVSVRDPTRPLLEDNAIVTTIDGEPARGATTATLFAECLVPAAVVATDLSYLSVVRDRLRERVRHLFPNLEGNLLAVVSAHDGRRPELLEPGARANHAAAPAATSTTAPPLPAYPMPALLSCDLPRVLDVGAVPRETSLRNLHIASAENLPGLGTEGEFHSAWGTVRRIGRPAGNPRRGIRRAILYGDA